MFWRKYHTFGGYLLGRGEMSSDQTGEDFVDSLRSSTLFSRCWESQEAFESGHGEYGRGRYYTCGGQKEAGCLGYCCSA